MLTLSASHPCNANQHMSACSFRNERFDQLHGDFVCHRGTLHWHCCSAVGPPFLLARFLAFVIFVLAIIWFCFMCYKIISELYLYAPSRIEHASNKVYFVHPATIMPGLFVPSFLIVILTNRHLFKPSMAPHNSRH
ncbi:hypothetical protein BX666DRAFT_2008873 [Dichotomocladium elegans]|nr:hypothetical protein BX666DRAFT_2008873 [Dichotomocladium elegans]